MNMPLIAAAAMAGGALLGFSLCWAATRLAGGNHAAAARLATTAKKKMGTMDKVLILEGVILVAIRRRTWPCSGTPGTSLPP